MKKVILIISLVSLFFAGCGTASSSQYIYQAPENIDDGLDVGALEEVNINVKLIEKGINEINRGKYKEVHSILIFKDGKLVLEEYFDGYKYKWDGPDFKGDWVRWDRSMLHRVQSVTKSIVSACVGIAIDKGFIRSVNQSIFDYLPEYQHLNTGGKDKITIEHLLTMTSGLQWDEWGASGTSMDNDAIGIWFHNEGPISFVLERQLVYEPGTHFTYNGGGIDILGEIIKNASGMDLDEFSGEYLFGPLKIDPYNWGVRFENGVIDATSNLHITPRDMVKIGVTFLNGGIWDGQQIISEQWVENSATTYPGNTGIKVPGSDSGRRGYAYTWWTKQYAKSDAFFAAGWGGQEIMVFPELNAVVVFTGGNYAMDARTFTFLERYVLPAFR